MKLATVFRAAVASHMEGQGVSQAWLARRLRISPQSMNRLLKGTGDVQLKTVARVVRALGLRVELQITE